ncbi:hypothetical protein KDW36_04160 [Burkholderia dolosa]|uniref:hypothetical protein n=1 Tax=Burkholderia cepacia complex TaxID=87882 RepID=UPI00018E3C44|nr:MULTISPECIES: hypothetical protein [Burkholderia cepacia complex]EED98606.1 conserved hypothetical protein [Burkholderia multivorans CGD1]MBR8312392.1 hypothetical protein [Burkholderia dolosa]MBU9282328.1 hypothetical protein [Burkholderia multivorans]
MKFLGLAPDIPAAPTVPDTAQPTTDTTTAENDAAARLRKRRGTAATILAGDSTSVASSSVNAPAASAAGKQLLGQ